MDPRPLRCLQLNVARSNARMHFILNTFTDYDILFLQEPWWGRIGTARSITDPAGLDVKGSVACPAWDFFLPHITQDQTPRVITYVRRNTRGLSVQPRPDLLNSPDTLVTSFSYGDFPFLTVNMYNAGPGRNALSVQALLNSDLHLATPTLILGDFNLHHPSWSIAGNPPRQASAAANDLVDWSEANACTLLNRLDKPTRLGQHNQADSIIDLTWANYSATELNMIQDWDVLEDSAVASDHNPIGWLIRPPGPLPDPPAPPQSYRVDPARREDWCGAFAASLRSNPPPATYNSAPDVEAGAKAFLDAFMHATSTVMPKCTGKSPVRSKWWNEDCDAAMRTLMQARGPRRDILRGRLHAAIRKAKRDWAMDVIQRTNQTEVWSLCNWASGSRRQRTPPIRHGDILATNPQSQGAAFADAFFPKEIPAVMPDQPEDPEPLPAREFSPFTASEVLAALSSTSNTSAPGVSGSSYRIIKWAFSAHAELFVTFLNGCVRLGLHPTSFKTAIIAVVPKPRRADMSNPRSYRPISLLECLGKLLEKLMAARITYEVGRFNLVPTNQFGGRDKSSVIDACLSLTHDIQAAWKNGLVASALALDVKGYFDNVNHTRLIRVMEILGFAPSIVAWTTSFLSDRSVRIRVDGCLGDPIALAGVGIPQGSPVSPILSTIYTTFILSSLDAHPNVNLKAYVDDVLVLATSRSADTNTARLSDAFNTVVGRLQAIGLDIDADKTELIHFTRARTDPGNDPSINIIPPNAPARTVRSQRVIRWLGIYFDRSLSFRSHVEKMANRARSAIAGLKLLANCVRGLSVANARLLYRTVIIPILTYGSPVWFTGNRQKSHIKILERAQNEALRWILGVFRTTPTAEMHHIGAILPISHLLRKLSANAAIRFRRLPSSSQVLGRTPPAWGHPQPDGYLPSLPDVPRSKPATIIHHLASMTNPNAERIFPYHVPPHAHCPAWGDRLVKRIPAPSAGPDDHASFIRSIHHSINTANSDPTSIVIYTDGSRHKARGCRRTGAGYVVHHLATPIHRGLLGLGKRAGVYDAEMFALASASASLPNLIANLPEVKHILLFSDNQAALRAIDNLSDHPAQCASIIFRKHVDAILANPALRITLSWVPGHNGFAGNEEADSLAKEAVRLDPPILHSTVSWALERAKSKSLKLWRQDWQSLPHTNLAAIALRKPPSLNLSKFHKEYGGPRHVHTRIIQTITGHGFIGEYYSRFLPDIPAECPCETTDTQTRSHILTDCPLLEEHRHLLREASQDLSPAVILGTHKGLEALAKFITASNAFGKT